MSPLDENLSAPLSAADIAALRRRQRGRNVAVLIALIAMAVLFYAISIVKFKVS